MGAGRAIRDLIDAAEACRDRLAVRHVLLEHMDELAPFDSAMLMPVAVEPTTTIAKTPQYSEIYRRNQRRYTEELARAHAAGEAFGAYVDTEVFGPGERSRLGFFNEIIAPQGIRSRLVAHLRFGGGMLATMHLCRHGRGRGYRGRELDVVREIAPLLGLLYASLPLAAGGGLDGLSRREAQIVACLRRGHQNKEIALLLGLSPNTVRNSLAAIFRKVGVTTRAELAARAERAGLRL